VDLRVGGASLTVSLVACRLETGRQHQIRIHLSESGHPVVGEKVYVRDYRGALVRGYAGKSGGRTLLHAERLGFLHPADGLPRTFVEPPPEDFAALLRRLEAAGGPRGGV
jgi:23S rRNA pseudouridine1911/1915/1917 synthase